MHVAHEKPSHPWLPGWLFLIGEVIVILAGDLMQIALHLLLLPWAVCKCLGTLVNCMRQDNPQTHGLIGVAYMAIVLTIAYANHEPIMHLLFGAASNISQR